MNGVAATAWDMEIVDIGFHDDDDNVIEIRGRKVTRDKECKVGLSISDVLRCCEDSKVLSSVLSEMKSEDRLHRMLLGHSTELTTQFGNHVLSQIWHDGQEFVIVTSQDEARI